MTGRIANIRGMALVPCICRGQRRTTLGVNAYGFTLYPYRNVFHGRIATKAERVKAIKDVACGCSYCNLREKRRKRVSIELVFYLY